MLVQLAEAHYERTEWAASFEEGATNEDVLREVYNNAMMVARLRQLLLYTCRERKKAMEYFSFQLHRYRRLVSRFSAASDMHLRDKKEEVAQAQE